MAMKICNSSFFEIDRMELGVLLDLIRVYEKINGKEEPKVYIDDIL